MEGEFLRYCQELDLLTKRNRSRKWRLSAPIFNIWEVKRIALTILFRFNAMADRVNPKFCVNSK